MCVALQLTKEATIFDSSLHANRIAKDMTFEDLTDFGSAECPEACGPNSTKEHYSYIRAALKTLQASTVPIHTKLFDSTLGEVAEPFREHIARSHLRAVCCVKMKLIFSQSAFVSQICDVPSKCECFGFAGDQHCDHACPARIWVVVGREHRITQGDRFVASARQHVIRICVQSSQAQGRN